MSTSTVTSRAASVTAVRSSNPFLRRIVLCVALTIFNVFVAAKFAGVLYQATFRNRFEQAGVTVLFLALLASLARAWYVTLVNRR